MSREVCRAAWCILKCCFTCFFIDLLDICGGFKWAAWASLSFECSVRFMIKQLLGPPKVGQQNNQNGNLIMVTKDSSPHWICSDDWGQEANWEWGRPLRTISVRETRLSYRTAKGCQTCLHMKPSSF